MAMTAERIALGTSAVHVSRVGLGLHAIGNLPPGSEGLAHDLIRRALEAGIDLFDTAPEYGQGAAERRLGEVIDAVGRPEIVISSKVGYLIRPIRRGPLVRRILREGLSNGPAGYRHLWREGRRMSRSALVRIGAGRVPGSVADGPRRADGLRLGGLVDWSPDGIRRSVEDSLERLGVDHIDLILMHDPEMHVREATTGAYRALVQLREEGTVSAIGIGINHVDAAIRISTAVDLDAVLIAGRYTLLDQSAAATLFPLAQRRRVTILAAGVFNSGILADPRAAPFYDYARAGRRTRARAAAMEAICLRYGVPLRTAALRFTAAHPAVGSVILGAGSMAHLEDDLAALERPIPGALWRDLMGAGLLPEDSVAPAD